MMEQRGLFIADSDSDICSGPDYSFNVSGIGTSYVDHCLISRSLAPYITDCRMHDDCMTNTSDHLSLSITIHVMCLPRRHMAKQNSRISWDKMSPDEINEIYTIPISGAINEIEYDFNDIEELTKALQSVVKSIQKCSEKLKKSKYSKGLKPYWNDVLRSLTKNKKKAWVDWCAVGKNRYGQEYDEYKIAKKEFRREMRKAKIEYEKEEMSKINESQAIDQKYFWTLVNRAKNRKKTVNPIRDGQKTVTCPNEVRSMWKSYFEELYTPKDQYDSDFKIEIEEAFDTMWAESFNAESFLMKEEITTSEVTECVKKLKNNKAPGWDQVTAEHLKYGGTHLMEVLTSIFNKMIALEVYPSHLKVGVIVPIPKGDKDVTVMENNRGITLLSILSKVFDNVLYSRHSKWSDKSQPLDPLQGAGKSKCSSIHTTYLLRETICHNIERGNTVYVGLLDTKKAFDTVWVKGVFVKMYQTRMDPVIWRMLVLSYKDFICHVRVGSELSEPFTAGQGLHQGAHWSMHLFGRHYNDMLQELREENIGACIGPVFSGNPTYADDVSIATLHKPLLQKLLDKAHAYSHLWQFDFNSSKSGIIIFGKDTCPTQKLTLGGSAIEVLEGDIHMGVLLSHDRDMENEFTKQRIGKSMRAYFAAQGLGSLNVPVSPIVLTRLYWTNCITTMTHGLEVFTLSKPSFDLMEQAHGTIAKMVQGMPKQTANITPTTTLGWRSLECHLDLMRMMFLWRILLMPMTNIYKQVTLVRLWYHLYEPDKMHIGPVYEMVKTFDKYCMLNVLDSAVKSGNVMNVGAFKKLARDIVDRVENDRFRITGLLYKSLPLFNACVTKIGMWQWWVFCDKFPEYLCKVRYIYRMLVSKTCLSADVCMYTEKSPICTLCDAAVAETAFHMIFDCDAFAIIRNRLWDECEYGFPQAMFRELNCMSSKEKIEFIVSAFRCDYTDGWNDAYKAIANFCCAMYRERQIMIE